MYIHDETLPTLLLPATKAITDPTNPRNLRNLNPAAPTTAHQRHLPFLQLLDAEGGVAGKAMLPQGP